MKLKKLPEENENMKKPKRNNGKGKEKSKEKSKDQVVRIEKLEQILAENGDELDDDTIVSMYMPRRRLKRFGAALLRLDRMKLFLLFLLLLVAFLFILAFMQEKMGNFTINLNRLELYRKGIAIDDKGTFDDPTARLTVRTVEDATNITITDLPDNLDDIDGDHNGYNYMAYTYYVRNAGKEDVNYLARVNLDACAKGAEKAVRIAIWRNGERTVYAAPASDGGPEDGCVSFESDRVVCTFTEENFLVGNVDKYTIVIWMEGEDPDCIDTIVGGSVQFSMTIDAMDHNDSSLFVKFIQDIKDTLTGDKPISAAGNDAPSYYQSGDVTWENRRNQ
ncbi:MAG: hypothetical protein J6X14_09560 [Lachnospiraceae bacterium]|nr:hypothetical protein [Lachnospiraceae bacterium]